jgi:hypothetical protein
MKTRQSLVENHVRFLDGSWETYWRRQINQIPDILQSLSPSNSWLSRTKTLNVFQLPVHDRTFDTVRTPDLGMLLH